MNESIASERKRKIRVITSNDNWIEGEAIRQLEKTAELPGMIAAVGLPELHPGKGIPVGAVFATEGIIYPYLIGNDVGCGMGLWKTDLKRRKAKRDKWAERLDLEAPLEPDDVAKWAAEESLPLEVRGSGLGTIGGGNHFAELQVVEKVEVPELFEKLELSKDTLYLLVHTGSRAQGEALLRSHVDRHKAEGLLDTSEEADRYLESHDRLLEWSKANRGIVARRVLDSLGGSGSRILDLCHNSISRGLSVGRSCWLHRKGAVPSEGPTVIAGSRGTLSYLVLPSGDQEQCLYSITHGAGRKWKRGDVKARLRSRYSAEALTQTELGGRVVCEDKELLYEEAPQAYKDIDTVVKVLADKGLIRVIASLRPLITYKTRASR